MSNIVGENHLPYVQDQIKLRQEILGKNLKSNEDVVWANGRDSWIRLMSSVDISDQIVLKPGDSVATDTTGSDDGASFRNQFLGLENYGGPMLAQEMILQGGTLNYDEAKFGIVESTLQNNPNTNVNYGFASDDGQRGYQPMPGITSFSSKTYSNGSLRKATLQILAHNRNQFNLIDSTYLKLGYTMLLEWGNSTYPLKEIKEDVAITRYATTSDLSALSLRDKFLYSYNLGADYFYTRIEENRKKSQGNYDGFLGKVSNFSWQFNRDGTYEINLELISIGSVVESLKVSTNLDSIQYLIPSGSNSVSNNEDEDRPTALETAIDVLTNTIISEGPIQEQQSVGVTGDFNTGTTSQKTVSPVKVFLSPDEKKSLGISNTIIDDTARPFACNAFFGSTTKSAKYYLRLGTLLNFINEKLLIYREEGEPSFISIDTADDTFCYSNGWSFSADPEKMIHRFEKKIGQQEIKIFAQKDATLDPFHDTLEDGTQVGRVMNLFFEKDYLKSIIKNNLDDEKGLSLYNFINEILKTINSLLGGVNKLKLRVVDKQTELSDGTTSVRQVLQIYDEVPTKYIEGNPVFNIYGFNQNEGNFVTDFNLNTELSKEFSTQISIGAQAGGRAVGEDATIFSKWNVGLVDRVIPTKFDFDKAQKGAASTRLDFKKLQNTYKNQLLSLRDSQITSITNITTSFGSTSIDSVDQAYNIPNVSLVSTKDEPPTFTKFVQTQKQFFEKVLSYDAERKDIPSPFVGFLPIKLSLTFDGLSGIRIFDKLIVDSRFLPKNYGNSLEFVITELDHSFRENKWETRVGTLSVPKLFPDKKVEVLTEDILDANVADLRDEENRTNPDSQFIDSYFTIKADANIATKGFGKGNRIRRTTNINDVLENLNNSDVVQSRFSSFLTKLLELYPQGYEFSVNEITRAFNPYGETGVSKSAHKFGLAVDISWREASEEGKEGTGKVLYGLGGVKDGTKAGTDPKKNIQDAKNLIKLGVADLALREGLIWGGTFTGSWKYDNVHFAVAPKWRPFSESIYQSVLKIFPKATSNNRTKLFVKDWINVVLLDDGSIQYNLPSNLTTVLQQNRASVPSSLNQSQALTSLS